MHFLRIHLEPYGHFAKQTLDFTDLEAGLCLVHGGNEAGKSTTLAAITDFLFGFDKKKHFDFQHDSSQLRVGATLVDAHGQQVTAIRRKGNKDTLLNAQNRPLDGQMLAPFLQGLDRDRFEWLYGLDHERLRAGGEWVLRGQGEVGALLFAAGSGLAGVQDTLEAMRNEAESLYKHRGKNQKIHILHNRLRELSDQQRRLTLAQSTWVGHRAEQEALQQKIAAMDEISYQKRRVMEELQRLLQLAPLVARLGHYRRVLEELGTIPPLNREIIVERLALSQRLVVTERERAIHQKELATLANELTALQFEEKLPPLAARINDLYREVRLIRENDNQLPVLEQKLEALNQQQGDLWRQVGGQGGTVDLNLLPDASRLATLRKLLETRPQLLTEEESLQRNLGDLERDAQVKRAEIQALGEVRDVTDLIRRLPELRQLLDWEQSCHRAFDKSATAQRQAEEKWRLLPHWRDSLPALEGCRPPGNDVLERYAHAYRRLLEDQRQAEDQRKQWEQEWQQLELERQQLKEALGGVPPTDSAVREARDERDRVWQLIRQHGLAGYPGSESAVVDGPSREIIFERLLLRADQLADARLREADRLAKWQQLENRREFLSQKRQEGVALGREVADKLKNLLLEWHTLWQALGVVSAGNPLEMTGWPEMRAEIIRLKGEADHWQQQGTQMQRKLSETLEQANAMVLSLGGPGMRAGEGVAGLLNRWETFVADVSVQAQRHQAARQRLAEIEQLILRHRARLADNQRKMVANDHNWQNILGRFGHESGMQVETNGEFLEMFSTLRSVFRQREELLGRIREIQRRRDHFMGGVRDLVLFLGEAWDHHEGSESSYLWLEGLKGRLDQAVEGITHQRQGMERQDKVLAMLRRTEENWQSDQQRFREIAARYGVQDRAAMESLEDRFKRREEVLQAIEACEKEILDNAGGLGLEEVLQRIAGQDMEDVQKKSHYLKGEMDEVTRELQALHQALGAKTQELEQYAGGNAAALVQQDFEDTRNELLHLTEHHVHLTLAATLLQQVIHRFQEHNQGPILSRASDFFRRLTLDSFTSLKVDFDTAKPYFYGVRHDGTRVQVEGMSDGTRDQLFLALRLGALDLMDESRQPMPMILDDILVHFDDRRATAALEVLAQLKRQVIYFTHHPHILDLAKTHLPSGSFGIQEMARPLS
ncbi:MAG: AAA family ATPase [Magnetococcales bacterium]|nr:AAA family ATPase [Magnetococcales bacterium]